MLTRTAEVIPFRPKPSLVRVPPEWPQPAGSFDPPWLKVAFVTGAEPGDEQRWRRRVSAFLALHGLEVQFTGGRLGVAAIHTIDGPLAPHERRGVLAWLLAQPELVLLCEQAPGRSRRHCFTGGSMIEEGEDE